MVTEKLKSRDVLPESFDSIAEAAAFWDNHDSADYEDLMEDVEFDVNIANSPKEKTAVESFKRGWQEARLGQTRPLSELWEEIEAE